MQVHMVSFPAEYAELSEQIVKTSIEKRQSISKTIRDMLCDATGFEPIVRTEIKKRNRTKKA
jgi:hypothetical protein